MTDAMRVWEEAFGAGFIDGQATTDPDAAAAVIERALAEAVAEREALIVKWLREQVTCGCGRSDCIADNYPLGYAEQIERGDHKERADG